MRRSGVLFLIVLLTATIATACAHRDSAGPVMPSGIDNNLRIQDTGGTVRNDNRRMWGLWEINVSDDRQVVEITPARMGQMHLNVVRLLEVAPCKNCLTIGNIKMVEPNVLEADLTLTHPYPGLLKYTGFDVRGIFISESNYTFPTSGRKIAKGTDLPLILNPDGYTPLFNPTEFPPATPPILGYIPGKHATGGDLTATLNPFVAYRRDAPRRMFEAGGSETRTVRLYAPTGPIHFGYAVDACWQLVENVIDPLTDFPPDANCLEAYRLDVSIGTGLLSEMGSQAPIQVEIYDHQGQETISTMTMEAPDLFTGEISLSFSTVTPNDAFLFTGTLPNDLVAADGEYPLLVEATDWESDTNLGDVAAWQVARARVGLLKGWARTWGGSGGGRGNSVAIDASGDAYVTGEFSNTLDFDPGSGIDDQTSNGEHDAFLSKFDSSGDFLWARTWGGLSDDAGWAAAIDDLGSIYVSGYFSETADLDPGVGMDNHVSNGSEDVFMSKFDSSGNLLWARTWGGPGDDSGWGVALDSTESVYITGDFRNTVDFDPGPDMDSHASNGISDAFLAKFDSNGDFMWARTWGGPQWDYGWGVAVDGLGNVHVGGSFTNTVDFDPGPGTDSHTSNGMYDIFLSSFDSSGNFLRAHAWGSPFLDTGCGVAIDSSNCTYLSGSFSDTVDFNPGPDEDSHSSNGDQDVFLGKFDSDGNFIWVRTWGGISSDEGYSTVIDILGNAYVEGYFWGTADFDPGSGVYIRSSNGEYDLFLSKLDMSGNFLWARTWGGTDWDSGTSVAIDASGSAYVTGNFYGTVDFDPGWGIDNHTSNGDDDVFLSKFPPDGNW